MRNEEQKYELHYSKTAFNLIEIFHVYDFLFKQTIFPHHFLFQKYSRDFEVLDTFQTKMLQDGRE